MLSVLFRLAVFVSFAFILPSASWAVSLSEFDDFEDGTVENWIWGRTGFGGPEVVMGGPDGENDSYLQIESFGGSDAPGTRMAAINREQWTGDFLAAGVKTIRMDAINLGPNFAFNDLTVRLAFSSTSATLGSGRVVTTVGHFLPQESGSEWQEIEFSLDPMTDLTAVAGSDITEVMRSVSEMRILSSEEPSFLGDQFIARIGVDNIAVVSVPEPKSCMMLIVAATTFIQLVRRRRHRKR